MDHRSVRDCSPLSKPLFSLFRPAFDLARLEDMRRPQGALLDYQEIRLNRRNWEELLDVFRAQSAILTILESAVFDPNSGARELLRMELQSYQRLLERLMQQSGNASF